MKVTIVTFFLIGAVFANPILYTVVLEPNGPEANVTLSLSTSQSSESDTSELQSSEETTSNESSESESSETTSEDKTSEEDDSQSDEDVTDSMAETRDDSMGSEENMRKSWVGVFSNAIRVMSAEDNSSTEVGGHSDHQGSKTQPSHTSTSTAFKWTANTVQSNANLSLVVENHTDSSDTSDSTDTSDLTGITDTTSESSESTSVESNETSETSDSESSESTESDASDSADLEQIKAKDCLHGADSTDCESEEDFFQGIGDDAHHSVNQLMVPDEAYRELSLRR